MSNPEKITIVVAEDNKASRLNLLSCLEKIENVNVIGIAKNGSDAVQQIDEKKPDLVLLDVEMPGKDGFEVLQSLKHNPGVIFVTAHEKFAVQAFEVNGIDYIVKPVVQERLEKAIERARESLGNQDQNIIKLVSELMLPKKARKRFTVKVKDQVYIIPVQEVCRFKAEDKYVFLCTREKEFFLNATLKSLIQTLDPDTFVKVNKSNIIAIDKIKKLKKNYRLETCLVLDDDKQTVIKVSRNHLPALKAKLEA
ncbi:MAG: response regulator transcription factor [Desulfobacteraceae bacterium]|nr:response regulator transcription factor [Desulfobacteraceae bacterium]